MLQAYYNKGWFFFWEQSISHVVRASDFMIACSKLSTPFCQVAQGGNNTDEQILVMMMIIIIIIIIIVIKH